MSLLLVSPSYRAHAHIYNLQRNVQKYTCRARIIYKMKGKGRVCSTCVRPLYLSMPLISPLPSVVRRSGANFLRKPSFLTQKRTLTPKHPCDKTPTPDSINQKPPDPVNPRQFLGSLATPSFRRPWIGPFTENHMKEPAPFAQEPAPIVACIPTPFPCVALDYGQIEEKDGNKLLCTQYRVVAIAIDAEGECRPIVFTGNSFMMAGMSPIISSENPHSIKDAAMKLAKDWPGRKYALSGAEISDILGIIPDENTVFSIPEPM